ncbi:MAG: glucose sorbosone dehydrogenase, partial [Chloroflexi bacterium]|nr:glucose sorbosone dehydrogenase [Chloroflexota bacterium]
YVYRGTRLPSLYGAYVYADFCSGKIWALRFDGAQVTEQIEIADTDLRISSFGLGRDGEIYILSFDGKIYRFAEP